MDKLGCLRPKRNFIPSESLFLLEKVSNIRLKERLYSVVKMLISITQYLLVFLKKLDLDTNGFSLYVKCKKIYP